MLKYNSKLKRLAANLRNNMTNEERKLWYEYLRTCTIRFVRQKIIGNYIVDFYSHKAKLVIEVDGGQHYEDKAKVNDTFRDLYLSELGLTVLRYTNIDVMKNFEGVCVDIDNYIRRKIPPTPLYKRGRNKASLGKGGGTKCRRV